MSAAHAIDAEVRLYDRLFTVPEPDSASAEAPGETGPPRDFKSFINSNSLEVAKAKCEPALANARPEERYQFERLGYFTLDPDSTAEKQIWNRTVTLRDTWAQGSEKIGERDAFCSRRRLLPAASPKMIMSDPIRAVRRAVERASQSGSAALPSKPRQRAVDSRKHLFFPENFEQVIQGSVPQLLPVAASRVG